MPHSGKGRSIKLFDDMANNMTEENVFDLYEKSLMSKSKMREPLSALCKECRYIKICNGSCKAFK